MINNEIDMIKKIIDKTYNIMMKAKIVFVAILVVFALFIATGNAHLNTLGQVCFVLASAAALLSFQKDDDEE